MTLARFAIACGAEPKWVQNVTRILGRRIAYTPEQARHVGLVKRLHEDMGVSLEVADHLAARVLRRPGEGILAEASIPMGDLVRVTVDVRRYLSDFAVRLARARVHYEPRRRGRPVPRSGSGISRAREYGIDIGLLEASLARRVADRVRRLDENMEFVRALRKPHV